MHFDGLIFDLDGTLWDCSQASANAFNLAYEEFGISRRVTKEFVESISGKPSSECDEILLSGVPNEIRSHLSKRFDQLEIEAIQQYAPNALYQGVDQGLRALRELFSILVVSNCGERYLEIFLDHTSVGGLFRDSECFGRTRKFKHENIRAIIERQEIKAACYIGDTAGDKEAAEKAGVPFFHASYGFGKPIGCSLAFPSFGELTRYFRELA